MSGRSGRVLCPEGGGSAGESWKSHIVRQLKHRDRNQQARFQDLVRLCTNLLDKTQLSSPQRCSLSDGSSSSCSLLQLKRRTRELTCQVEKLQLQINNKDNRLEEQRARLLEEEQLLAGVSAARLQLKDQVKQVEQEMGRLKKEYDSLLQETKIRENMVRGQSLKQALTCEERRSVDQNPSHRCSPRFQATPVQPPREANALKEQASVQPEVDSLRCRSSLPQMDKQDECVDSSRGTSVMSARVFSPIRKLFQKQQVRSAFSADEDPMVPVGSCLAARVPVRGLQVPVQPPCYSATNYSYGPQAGCSLDAHEQGINAASFSCAERLATGGTDRVVKLWDISSGLLVHRATLDGGTEGITCVHFSQTGHGLLAASYDKSALLWQRGSATPKLTLTGHSRKVTAARFCTLPHHAATGSADRTIRLWDLHRAACVQLVQVRSYCSDLVCADHLIISGHYDCKVCVWDSRTLRCIQELAVQGKITSLDISSDHRQLLSCCRDNSLQLLDLRRWSKDCMSFRADGFTCGSDSTKAVISPDGDFVAAGSADGSLYIWKVSTGTLETHLPGKHSSAISAVCWSPSGKNVVSVDKRSTVVLWSHI